MLDDIDSKSLQYHNYYSSLGNWEKVIHPALVGMYGIPQQYYVPRRIRASYKPRLESAGLWTLPQQEEEGKSARGTNKLDEVKQEAKQTFTQTFEREKVCACVCNGAVPGLPIPLQVQDKAKEILGIYARLLEGKQFVYKKQYVS